MHCEIFCRRNESSSILSNPCLVEAHINQTEGSWHYILLCRKKWAMKSCTRQDVMQRWIMFGRRWKSLRVKSIRGNGLDTCKTHKVAGKFGHVVDQIGASVLVTEALKPLSKHQPMWNLFFLNHVDGTQHRETAQKSWSLRSDFVFLSL